MLWLERLARQPVLAHERGRPLRRLGRLGCDEALDDARQVVRGGAADDPLEQRRVLRRDLERRVTRRHLAGRVREPQDVAVGRRRRAGGT